MEERRTVLISGASGLIGQPLTRALLERGHSVRRLSSSSRGDFKWNIARGEIDAQSVVGVDVVIHLAGESVAQRWTQAAKKRILSSRVDGTRLLVQTLREHQVRCAFILASGISFYGVDRGEFVDESSCSGDGFLAEVTRQWEAEAEPLEDLGQRTAFMRTGIVLSRFGGALAKMLSPFKMGLGGRIGNGRQQMSWVSLPDLISMYVFAVENEKVKGPVNAVAPEPISNAAFTKVLGNVLGRPTVFPLPKSVVKTIFGEMGRETVLSNLAVLPKHLQSLGFEWEQPTLEVALREALNKS